MRHTALLKELFSELKEVDERPDGFSFAFPGTPDRIMKITEWIVLERLCCNFLRFRFDLKPRAGNVWLTVSGPRGTKELLRGYLK